MVKKSQVVLDGVPMPALTFYKAKDGWRWRIRARNGRIIAESGEGYSGYAKAEKGCRAVIKIILDAYTEKPEWEVSYKTQDANGKWVKWIFPESKYATSKTSSSSLPIWDTNLKRTTKRKK